MLASDLRERTTEDLVELLTLTRRELFQNRMKNQTNQLEDTSLLKKARRDIARIESILSARRDEQGSES